MHQKLTASSAKQGYLFGRTEVQDLLQVLALDWAVLQVFDDYLQQLGEDTAAYVRTVCQTIVLTVPKAVIHCQVPPLHSLHACCGDAKAEQGSSLGRMLESASRGSNQTVPYTIGVLALVPRP